MKIDRTRLLFFVVLGLTASCVAQAPVPMQKEFSAVRAGADLNVARKVSVIVSSRRTEDPPMPIRSEKLHAQLVKTLHKTPYTYESDSTAAQMHLELVIETHQPLGTASKKKTAPYMFLLLRDHSNASVQYCGYQRVSYLYERALDRLTKDLLRSMGAGPAATGDLNACAAAAMRLSDVGL